MEEKEQVYQPILPPAPEDEKPEEGFVPYCGSEEAELERRHPVNKTLVLIILILLLVFLFGGSLLARQYNYYHAVLSTLQFDYREGEAVYSESIDQPGAKAVALSEEIGNRPVRVNAAMYMFDLNQKLQNIMTEYEYSHSAGEDILKIQTGSENALFMKKFTYRASSEGYQKQSGSGWKDDPNAYVPNLNE